MGERSAERSVEELAAELEAAKQELAAFAYSASHDLRAPLRSIIGFSDALFEDCAGKLGDSGADYLNEVRRAAAQMEKMITGLVELSRVAASEVVRERVDVSSLVESIARELQSREPQRNVRFSIQPGVVADGDPRLLKIALEHLIRNAWKFTSKRAAAHIEVGVQQRNGRRTIFIRDDGAGFDPAYAGRMFGAFQRFHSTSEFDGIGIGLAIVQRIVSLHGGRISAEGKVDSGATIYIDLE